jgi:hypothetical protein
MMRIVLDHAWKVLLLTALIALTAVYAPELPLKFIYTEF